MDFFNYNLYEELPKYEGEDTFFAISAATRIQGTIFLIIFGLPFLLLAFATYDKADISTFLSFIAFALLEIIIFGYVVSVCYRKIVINESGISLLSFRGKTIKFFNWDKIENIHVLIGLTSSYKFYISTDPFKIYGLGSNTASSPEYIIAHYSPEIIHCILQYWDKMIDNYDDPKSWKEYVEKL